MAAITVILRVWFAVVLSVAPLASHLLEPVQPVVANQDPTPRAAPRATDAEAIRISQVYGGGGGSGATYACDFIELFNASAELVQLQGWSVQYGTATLGISGLTRLGNATIAGYGYLLVAEYCGTGTPLPAWDVKGVLPLPTSNGKVLLARTENKITDLKDQTVADLVGYGVVSEFEGTGPAPAPSSTSADLRKDGGCTDTAQNGADFDVGAVTPRNSQSKPAHVCPSPDSAPAVSSTSPAAGATNVARDAVLTVAFSEPVSLNDDWFEIQCDLSGPHAFASATVTGGPESYTIDPAVDFMEDEACRMTIAGNAVHDTDLNDPPDILGSDYVVDFRTAPSKCGDPADAIHGIQGTGSASPVVGQVRTVEGVVTGDFQGGEGLSGYFVQEEAGDADTDAHTSEGIFIDELAGSLGDVTTGSWVRVRGTVSEVAGMASLTNVTLATTCGAAEVPQPIDLALPLTSTEWEQYEGMLVRFGERLTVADSAGLGSEGRLTLVGGELPRYYTQQNAPDAIGFVSWKDNLALNTVILDDGSQVANTDPIRYPPPALSASNTVRAGDAVEAGLTGVVDGRGSGNVIQPTAAVSFVMQNERPAAPARTAGNIRVVFFSLGDYFNVTSGVGGTRGASSPEEFTRQRNKLIRGLIDLNADVIAVSKLEDDGFGPGSALADLVAGLNAGRLVGTTGKAN